jgi:hypothetical protein
MPEERLYTIRGQSPATTSHKKIQLSSYDPTHQYALVEFKVVPAGTALNSDCYGIITMGENNAIDPSDPDFGDQNQIAWSHAAVRQPVPPGIAESVTISRDDTLDVKLFAYDLWLHTEDAVGAEKVNWMLKIKRYKTSSAAGSISSLRQYLVNTA